ncbi:MAG TPA: SH3 domain-containing C40 family peptidase [Clostridia bacterium]|nr:SH3 domain-containing C40 family peptidase [Clostridia bacterium]
MTGLLKSLLSISIVIFLFVTITPAVFAESNQTGAVSVDVLNLRQSPTVTSKILDQLSKGMMVLITEKRDDWYKITVHENGRSLTGWVLGQYVSINQKDSSGGNHDAAYNQGSSFDIENSNPIDPVDTGLTGAGQAGTISTINTSIIHTISTDANNVSRVGTINAYSISVISASKVNAINTSTISVISLNPISSSPAAATDPVDASFAGAGSTGSNPGIVPNVDELVQFAKSLLGTPYVYGGMSPAGFDCSGFTSYVFGAFGIRLERVSSDQAKQGIEILKENLKPGDLVFFDTNGGHSVINHTGIFIGDGKFIHASSGTSHCVIISDLTTGYYSENYITARSILNTP